MSFTSTAATLAAAGVAQVRELPMSPYAFGAIAFASFLVLLAVLWTFRNTAVKYDTPLRVHSGNSADAGSQGTADPGAHH